MDALRRKWSLTLKVVPFAATTIVLIGFLISGVLADYKESEKLSGDLASSLEGMFDGGASVHASKRRAHARDLLHAVIDLSASIRRNLTRIRTIRETSFVGQGHTIVEVMAGFLIVGIPRVRMRRRLAALS